MDDNSDLEDLESLLSEHFGITPLNTPAASQDSHLAHSDEEEEEEGEENDELLSSNIDLDDRVQRYVPETSGEDETCDVEVDAEEDIAGDDSDRVRIRHLIGNGCGCQMKCGEHLKDKEESIFMHVLNVREMERSDKDMYIIGALINPSDQESTKRGKKRVRTSVTYMYMDLRVCKKAFMVIFDIGKHSLQSIITHINTNGPVPRHHGNTGRKPKHSLEYEDIKKAIQHVLNYAENYGIPQPAAPRGRDNDPPIYLPCDTQKKQVHEQYVTNCVELGYRSIKYTTFCKVWKHCLGHIKIASPREDVCATCERIRKEVTDAVTECDKIAAAEKMRCHNLDALSERELYNNCIQQARETRNSENKYVHYTFDYSQNVSIPNHARQTGPIYFTTPRKIQIFGFRIDGIPRQLNFLIDEDQTIGKDGAGTHGPNAVISMVDWVLNTHGSGEVKCAVHADNCPGQNKNQYVLGYFMWRVITGRHEEIEYLMQIPGHSRCYIDGGFGLLKQKFRKTDCDTLDHLHHAVDQSSATNIAVRYPSWSWRDWKSFLSSKFRPVRGVRSYQYFRFSAAEPGIVTARKSRDGDEVKINILKCDGVNHNELPELLSPGGMTKERQLYLYKTVRPFVRPQFQDMTCPRPTDV